MKRKYIISKEQQQFRDVILNRKPRVKKAKERPYSQPSNLTAIDYTRNCMFWINEYLQGRESKEQLKKSIKALQTLSEHLPNWISPSNQK
jgi:uncharacterized protein YydD (DUF2326 family)